MLRYASLTKAPQDRRRHGCRLLRLRLRRYLCHLRRRAPRTPKPLSEVNRRLDGYAAYMPVMLAIMRKSPAALVAAVFGLESLRLQGNGQHWATCPLIPATIRGPFEPATGRRGAWRSWCAPAHVGDPGASAATARERDQKQFLGFVNFKLLHELFLNQGLYLLLGGILVGYVSRFQGEKRAVRVEDLARHVASIAMFQGLTLLVPLGNGDHRLPAFERPEDRWLAYRGICHPRLCSARLRHASA